MDHSYFKDRISAYLDNGLPPYEHRAVSEHLEDCEECRKLLAELRKVDELVEEHGQLSGDEYWERSARKIEQALGIAETEVVDVTPRRGWGLGWKWATAAASVAVLVIIGLHESDILRYRTEIPDTRAGVPMRRQPEAPDAVTDTETESESQALSPVDRDEELLGRDTAPSPERKRGETEVQDAGQRSAAPGVKMGVPVPLPPEEDAKARIKTTASGDRLQPASVPDVAGEYIPIPKKGQAETLMHRTLQKAAAAPAAPGDGAGERGAILSLDEWRHRRDSLTRLLKLEPAVRLFDVTSDYKSDVAQESEGDAEVRRKAEADLLEACYRIAINSGDSAEVRRVSEVIERVAADSGSVNQGRAARYLERLDTR